jgi:hypothetical protein
MKGANQDTVSNMVTRTSTNSRRKRVNIHRSRTKAYDLGGLKGAGSDGVALRLLDSGFRPHQLLIGGTLRAVYAYSASSREWMSYDNAASIAAKADYVMARHLGGMMMWEIGEDMPVDSPYSLLGSAHRVLLGTDR